jgi:DHA2 family multidrug resistance protein-like MFS transporter
MDRTIDALHADDEFRRTRVDGLPIRRRIAAIAALSLGTTIASINAGSVTIALPTIAHELGVEASQAVFVVTIYQVVLLMTVLPFAALGDRIGHRTIYQWGQVVFIGSSLLCFLAHSLLALVLVRALQAFGGAAILSVGMVMLRGIYPQAKLGRGMALNTLIAASSASLAPSIGGFIISVTSWPWIFMACVPFGIASLIIGQRSLPDPVRRDEPYDVLAAVMCAVMFGTAVIAIEGAVHSAPWLQSAALFAAALVIGTFFVRREMRQANPVLPVDLLRNRHILLLSLGTFTASIASMIALLSLPFRLQSQYGYSPAEAGIILASWTLVTTIVAPAAGMLSDRMPASIIGSFGMAVSAAGLATLAFLPEHPQHFDLIWRSMLAAVGFGLFYPPNARQIILSVPMARAAAAGGLTQTTRMTGQVLGSSATAGLLAMGSGLGSLPSLIAAGLAILGGLCSIALFGSSIDLGEG